MEIRRMLLTNRYLRDLNPIIVGEQHCVPGHQFGPHIRRYTLLHYVVSGKGTLYARGKHFAVGPGQAFIVLPGEVTTYVADSEEPWYYRWIGFDGGLSNRFLELPAVFPCQEQVFPKLQYEEAYLNPEFELAAQLIRLYAVLFSGHNEGNLHVRKVQTYIHCAYMQNISVEGISQELNLDRRYLSRLFKAHMGVSIQQYLLDVRMEAADRCLKQGYCVKDAALMSGYQDVANFSRMYKKHYGISPGSRRKTQKRLESLNESEEAF